MTIYAVVNTKGGVGKTTTAIHIATMLSALDKTLLIDGDTQGSAASWAVWRRDAAPAYSPATTQLAGQAINREGRELAQGFVHTVVDAGGRDASGLRAALLLADRAIVPVGVSQLDSAAITDLLEIMDLARDINPKLQVQALLTRLDPRTKDADSMIEYLQENGLNVLQTRVCERVVYRRAIGEGLTVIEIGTDEKANFEMQSLLKEVTA